MGRRLLSKSMQIPLGFHPLELVVRDQCRRRRRTLLTLRLRRVHFCERPRRRRRATPWIVSSRDLTQLPVSTHLPYVVVPQRCGCGAPGDVIYSVIDLRSVHSTHRHHLVLCCVVTCAALSTLRCHVFTLDPADPLARLTTRPALRPDASLSAHSPVDLGCAVRCCSPRHLKWRRRPSAQQHHLALVEVCGFISIPS
jgi:hypothetical protein